MMTKFMAQCVVSQIWFEVRRTVRNRQFLFSSLIMPVVFYFLFLKVNGSNLSVGGTTWKTYFLMSMAAFSVVGSCLFSLSSRISYERTQGWFTLVRTTPLPSSLYVVGKLVGQWVIMAISVGVLFIIGDATGGVRLPILIWVTNWLWLTVGALPFMALGILIGVTIGVEATYLFANIIYLVLAVLGGLWFPIQIMPKAMQSIAKWTPTYRFAHVAWANAAGTGVHFSDITVTAAYTIVFVLLTIWILRARRHEAA